ncbi:hypothetical protein KM043_000760 [Ampulex compressa]|nr:hypothetical protein KM043_000760 [Ampulex compressa]
MTRSSANRTAADVTPSGSHCLRRRRAAASALLPDHGGMMVVLPRISGSREVGKARRREKGEVESSYRFEISDDQSGSIEPLENWKHSVRPGLAPSVEGRSPASVRRRRGVGGPIGVITDESESVTPGDEHVGLGDTTESGDPHKSFRERVAPRWGTRISASGRMTKNLGPAPVDGIMAKQFHVVTPAWARSRAVKRKKTRMDGKARGKGQEEGWSPSDCEGRAGVPSGNFRPRIEMLLR